MLMIINEVTKSYVSSNFLVLTVESSHEKFIIVYDFLTLQLNILDILLEPQFES